MNNTPQALVLLVCALATVTARGAERSLDDVKSVTQDQSRGPRLTDEAFFAALDLARPGLEHVAAAVAAGDHTRAKAELLTYYRVRPDPTGRGQRRRGSRNESPSLAALTSWNGFVHSLSIEWTGWKRFRLTKRDFQTVHRPLGWDFIRYVAFTLDEPGQKSEREAEVHLDELSLTGPGGTVDLGQFEDGPGTWEGMESSADLAHSGQRSGRWVTSPGNRLVRNAGLVHDWTNYDALEFWMYSPAANGARVSVVLDSEDLEFPETAQDVLDHRWLRVHGKLYDMGQDIDWSLLPFAGDDPDRTREWTWCGLNRMHQWTTLMRVYRLIGDEKYAREVVSQLLDWTADCPVPELDSGNQTQTWRTIECGLRMMGAWPDAFFGLLKSPNFTPEACCVMLKSMVEHARHLQRWRTGGNWLAIECAGMARVGSVFPEFRESTEWRKQATDTLYAQLVQQVYPDGAQFELSTGYQYVALASFLQVYRLAKRSGVELPADYAQRLAAMYRCDLYLAEPDWRLPDLNDGSRRSVLDSLAVGAREVAPDDPVLQWAASGGQTGTPPPTTSTLFPFAGWMVMRSGWQGSGERYGLLEVGPYGYGHQHEDKLNLIIYGYGREHISDAGYYDYDASDWRRYVLSTRGHNTLRIDGQDQHRAGLQDTYVTKEPVADLQWATNSALDYGAGVYADGYGPQRATKVTHRRELVFVKPDYFVVVDTVEGEGVHQIESMFHLNHDEAEIEGPVARSVDPGVSNVVVAAAPVEGLQVRIGKGESTPEVQGFIPNERWRASWKTPQARSAEHGKREVPTVIYTLTAALPAKLVYVLMPYPLGQRPDVTCRLLPLEGQGTAVQVLLPAGQQRAVLIGKPGQPVSSGTMRTQRQVAVFDTSGPAPCLRSEL